MGSPEGRECMGKHYVLLLAGALTCGPGMNLGLDPRLVGSPLVNGRIAITVRYGA